MRKIRVMIVEDSAAVRELLEHIVGADPRFELAGSVASGEDALRTVNRVSPDVISMDIRLPGMNGLEATRRILAERPTPIVVVSASVDSDDLMISMNALRAGAMAVVEKPVGTSRAEYDLLADRLCTQLAIMSQVKVIRQRIDRGLRFGPGAAAPAARTARLPAVRTGGPWRAVGIAASTGGPRALEAVLGPLPAGFPVPVFLVQHIGAAFLGGFVSWLRGMCRMKVVIAADGRPPERGTVYVAAADRHLTTAPGRLRLDDGEPVSSQKPSGTVLFRSMAVAYGGQSIGVLLTGMGDDGAQGLCEMRAAGAHTIAEDEATAVVYGMPGAAVRAGGVSESLPLTDIAPRLLELVCPPAEGS